MRVFIHLAIFAVAAILGFSLAENGWAAADEKTVTITDKDKEPKVELAKGDKLLVKLPANPTTGFTWLVAKGESDTLRSKEKPVYEAANKDKKVIGGGGTQTFTFEAGQIGEVEIVLNYQRPFEKDKEPAKTYKFKVVVK